MKDSQAFDFDGEYGRGYDELARQVIPAYEQIFRATAALFENELPSDARVLVVGSGTGTEVATFGAAQPRWTIIGVDPSAEMVRMTERRADELGLDDRVMIVHGFARDLPLTPPYDAATIINVLHFLEDDGDKADLLTSVAERTRSGGLLALVDLHGDPTSDEFRFLMKGWEGFMRHQGLRGTAQEEFLSRLRRGIVYVPGERLIELCSAASWRLEVTYYRAFLYGGWLLRKQ